MRLVGRVAELGLLIGRCTRMKASSFALLAAVGLGTTGCVSMAARNFGDTKPFPGVRGHAEIMSSPVSEETWWLVDLPFSVIFDILAFPYDLAK